LPVHFIAKKDGKQRMVQDYRHINQWTIKNGYPLSLIVDILDGVGKRKVFTMYIGAYEPMVMYFGLTNSPATFQTMINDLFQDLIN